MQADLQNFKDAFVRTMRLQRFFGEPKGSPKKLSRTDANHGRQAKALKRRRRKNEIAAESRRINRARAA